MKSTPIIKDVLLVGGGHSHVLFIRMWAMQAMPGVRLTLVSEKTNTPYSGMLPGLIAGHYTEDEVHIDLARLCSWAGVRFIEQRVASINLKAKSVAFESARPSLSFDVLSLDTGSTPELAIQGSERFSVPVKPVHNFYAKWQALQLRIQEATKQTERINVGVVGSGAGGFELVMAMQHALNKQLAQCHWFIRGERALKGRPEKVSAMAIQAAMDAGVVVHTGFDVVDVKTDALISRDERTVALDEIVWCAAAKAPAWPEEAGLAVDKRGFVFTNQFLQSLNHDYVFATGDIGTQKDTPSDKAGVFAVRQAPVLFQNIRRYLLNKPLKTYKPQTDFLSLMATGGRSAIGNRGNVTIQGAWVWKCKDYIDKKFMNQFRLLPKMTLQKNPFAIPQVLLLDSSVDSEAARNSHMRCRGCGGKVGASILDSVLSEINNNDIAGTADAPDVVCGLTDASDAAIFNTDSRSLVQSVDQITALCDDPYVFGRIAAVHALSDVYTSGAKVHSAQVLVNVPFADHKIVKRDLQQLMAGVVDALNEDNCVLLGGHTSEGPELALGFVVNGFVEDAVSQPINPLVEGDCLILTKPLGTGVLLAGMMRQMARGSDVQSALHAMQISNSTAAQVLYDSGAKAVTDITGFGLLGHLQRMLSSTSTSTSKGAVLSAAQIPLYSGAYHLAESGVSSTLLAQNQQVLEHIQVPADFPEAWLNILCDPQTSGGLLGVVPNSEAEMVVDKLRQQGCCSAQIVGKISEENSIAIHA